MRLKKKIVRGVLALVILLIVAVGGIFTYGYVNGFLPEEMYGSSAKYDPNVPVYEWQYYRDEARIEQALLDLSNRYQAGEVAIINAKVVYIENGVVVEDQTLIITNGIIDYIGPNDQAVLTEGINQIDALGRYVMAGLADMHTHSHYSHSDLMLYLSYGVTTIREMNGSPWMIDMRDAATVDDYLVPNMMIAGRIISEQSLDGFAEEIETPADVRAVVQSQAEMGYDYIKIHNFLSQENFDAVVAEAAAVGLDLIGHAPQGIPLEHVMSAGLVTFEHMKGYISDFDLEVTDEDYAGLNAQYNPWLVPTLTYGRYHARGELARSYADALPTELIAKYRFLDWQELMDREPNPRSTLQDKGWVNVTSVTQELIANGARFVAGTDTGSYPMLFPGMSLHQELQAFEGLGMTPAEALRTGTVNAASAVGREGQFGELTVGVSADLILLSANPLETTLNIMPANIDGVMLRGRYLNRSALDEIKATIGAIYDTDTARTSDDLPTAADIDATVTQIEGLNATGLPLSGLRLDMLASYLDAAGDVDNAARVRALM